MMIWCRGAQLKSHGGPKKFFRHIQGTKLISFNPFKGCFYQRNKQIKHNLVVLRDRLKASVGHIWPAGRMLCMPDLEWHSSPIVLKITIKSFKLKLFRNINFSLLLKSSFIVQLRFKKIHFFHFM